MLDNVTLKLNADPLIISALKEDITSEDVSTNSVMPEPKKGEVQLICKQDGIICGLPIFARVFTLLDENTVVDLKVKDGDKVVLDGSTGEVFVDPEASVEKEYEEKRKQFLKDKKELEKYIGQPSVTKDGVQVEIVANIGKPEDVDKVLQYDGGRWSVPYRVPVYGPYCYAYRGRAI